jgi:cytidylate kinase
LKSSTANNDDVLEGLVVAIDGPAGSGKSTTARRVAARLGLRHIDTGAMYRAVALAALRRGADPEDEQTCAEFAATLEIAFRESSEGGQRVLVGGEDVTLDIRTPEVTRAVSPVSAHASVRAAMVRRQRSLTEEGGAVLEGRDIGTVVLPSADVKIYLVASTRVRAERRALEMREQGIETTVDKVEQDIVRRDQYDSSRETSPLRRAVGSTQVDTSDLTIEGQVDRIVDIARETAGRLAALSAGGRRHEFTRFRPRYRFACVTISGVLKLFFGLRVSSRLKVDYKENYIYACNHVSYGDPPFVGSNLPREAYYVAKSALFKNPFFGWLIRTFNAIPVRRGVFDREAMKRSLDVLSQGKSLMIFPEGSRVYDGRLGKPKSGVGYLAVNSGVAVIPVFVSGTNRLKRCLFRRERMTILQGRPIRLAPGTQAEFGSNDDYRAYSEMVMEAIQDLKDEFDASKPALLRDRA